jgi:hypothetical protein
MGVEFPDVSIYQKREYGERRDRMYHQRQRRDHVQSLEFCNLGLNPGHRNENPATNRLS